MKKQSLFQTLIVVAVLCFASCQKENTTESRAMDAQIEQSTNTPPIDEYTKKDLPENVQAEIKLEKKDVLIEPKRTKDGQLATRSGIQPVHLTYPCLQPDFNISTLYCGSYVAGSTIGRYNRYNDNFYSSLGFSSNLNGGDKVYYFNLTKEQIVNFYLTNTHKNLAMLLFKGHYEWKNGYIVERFDDIEAWSTSTSTTMERLANLHLTPGHYMLIIDSAPHGESSFNLSVACHPVNTSCNNTPGVGLFDDDFQSYHVGNISAQSPNWNKWNDNLYDGYVYQQGTAKYLQVDYKENKPWGDQADFILDLGQRSIGNYQLTYDMWLYANNTANFNIQKIVRTELGASFYIAKNGEGIIYLEGGVYKTFNYPNNQWAKIRFDVNLDANKTSFYINNVFIASWACTASRYAGNPNHKLFRGLNFLTSTYGLYYIDNVCFIKRF